MPTKSVITIKTFSATILTISAARSNSYDTIDPIRFDNVAKAQQLFSLTKYIIIIIIFWLILSVNVSGSGIGSGFGSGCGCGC